MERKAPQKLPSHTRIKRKNLTSINTESDKLLNLVTELRWSVLINEISSEFVRQPCAIWGERSKPRRLMALITFFLTYVYKTMTNLVSGKAKRSWDIRGKTYPSQYNYCARNEKKKVLNSGILIVPRRDLDFQRMQTSRTVTSHVAF